MIDYIGPEPVSVEDVVDVNPELHARNDDDKKSKHLHSC